MDRGSFGAKQYFSNEGRDSQGSSDDKQEIKTSQVGDFNYPEVIKSSMSMQQCRDMITRVFNKDIKEWYEGEFKTADDWLKANGVDEVAMLLENDYNIQEK